MIITFARAFKMENNNKSDFSSTPGIIKNLSELQNYINKILPEEQFESCIVALQQMANELTEGITDKQFKIFDERIKTLRTNLSTCNKKGIGNSWAFSGKRETLKNEINLINRQLIRTKNKLGLGLDKSKTKKLKR